ncbi:hypothetical protein QBC40DRAFT_257406 [Triangularia verruculosa]|uniref:Uncharacterized protein n=1 Tax=Triangularia verruculosa TaxID=2587418 RepID=A0AAN6XCX2_9PEZI|nr:hypothetical protein QBC40DRAFT_257406 [Triangularia verruculosa]
MDDVHRYKVFFEAVHLLAALWPPGDHCSQVTKRWTMCEDLLPHLERFHQLYVEYSDWEQYDVDQDLPMLMNEAAVYLHERYFSHEGKAYASGRVLLYLTSLRPTWMPMGFQCREEAFGKLDKVSYKTGRVLQALGNVKSSQAQRSEELGDHEGAKKLWDESFVIHSNCLRQYESTLGKFAHRTADACHKLAEHHIRRKEHCLAQDYLDRALSIWGNREWYKNESARSSFLRGSHLVSLKGKENMDEGKQWLERAKVLRAEILPGEKPRKPTTADFDDLVCFWSI